MCGGGDGDREHPQACLDHNLLFNKQLYLEFHIHFSMTLTNLGLEVHGGRLLFALHARPHDVGADDNGIVARVHLCDLGVLRTERQSKGKDALV